jgi:hypothetical protein
LRPPPTALALRYGAPVPYGVMRPDDLQWITRPYAYGTPPETERAEVLDSAVP